MPGLIFINYILFYQNNILKHLNLGMTLKKARLSLENCDNCSGLAYVALSRVTTKEGLLIDSQYFDSSRLTGVKLNSFVKEFDVQTSCLVEKTNKILDLEETSQQETQKEIE